MQPWTKALALGVLAPAAAVLTVIKVMDLHGAWNADEFDLRAPLVAGLPVGDKGAEEFKRRIVEQFPLGSSEVRLSEVLCDQGFRSYGSNRDHLGRTVFRLDRPGLFCTQVWHVLYRSDDGRIANVTANRGSVCL